MSDITFRYQKIGTYIREQGNVRVSELCKHFYLSEATVRRILIGFEKNGLVQRYHGGAILVDPESLSSVKKRQIENQREKDAIGQLAASFVQDGATILMMGGTTVNAMCPFLRGKHLTVITNSLPVVNSLAWFDHIQLVVLGGVLNPPEMEIRGALTEHSLTRLRANQLFLGATGLHTIHGLMTDDPNAVGTYSRCISVCDDFYVLADHTKFLHPSGTIMIEQPDGIRHIVTDANVPRNSRITFEQAGVKLHIASLHYI
jgi:DeoR/GlpR family transcriptional regulator of sugar metabolism